MDSATKIKMLVTQLWHTKHKDAVKGGKKGVQQRKAWPPTPPQTKKKGKEKRDFSLNHA